MTDTVKYAVEPKEGLYFALRIIFALALYLMISYTLYEVFSKLDAVQSAGITMVLVYMGAIMLFFVIQFGVMIGHIKGNGIKVNAHQFPEIDAVVTKQTEKLGMSNKPSVYILQSGGVLNAFAARFVGSNYIVLYSDLVEAALESDPHVLEFVIAHELGHIKRRHMQKRLWTLPAAAIPFLGAAYSRACEYTCDNIGAALAPNGVKNGLQMLAAGRKLFKEVNAKEMMRQNYNDTGFWYWFAEKVSSHPHLSNRLEKQRELTLNPTPAKGQPPAPHVTDDHSRYMPS